MQKTPIHFPLTGGLDTKTHPFALDMPYLSRCENAVFTEPGAIAKRRGHAAFASTSIAGGGTISNIRGLARRGEELICFADNSDSTITKGRRVFSWSPGLAKWVDCGAYEGVELHTLQVAVKSTKQVNGDMASAVSGTNEVVVYAWFDYVDTGVHFQVFDATNGLALCDEQALGSTTGRPRCLAVGDRLHVYYHDETAARIKVKIIDPANVIGTVGNAAVTISNAVPNPVDYDVVERVAGSLLACETAGGYDIFIVTSAGTVTTSASKARVASIIAVAYEPNTDRIAVGRVNATPAVKADLLNGTSLADVSADVTIQTTAPTSVQQITGAFRTTAESGGTYRCVFFYRDTPTLVTSAADVIRAAYFGTDGATAAITGPSGGSTNWLISADLATRAFARGSFAYVVVSGTPQNDTAQPTHFLYREDGLLIAKASPYQAGGGTGTAIAPLPHIQDLGSDRFAWVSAYTAAYRVSGMRRIDIDFDSQVPYRGAELGGCLYMTGGYTAMYDGVSVVEQNFLVVPKKPIATASAGGSLSAGSYSYIATVRNLNAVGELERSTFFSAVQVTAAANDKVTLRLSTLTHTAKRGTRGLANIEVWRTVAAGSTYFKVTNADGSATSGNNRYVANDVTVDEVTLVDVLSDADLVSREAFYLNTPGAQLDNLPGDAATVIALGQARLFLAGMEDPFKVRYSKLRLTDDGAAFNDALEIFVPPDGGAVTAVVPLDSALLVFAERAVYYVPGNGLDNTGGGAGYGEPHLLSSDTGCTDARLLAKIPDGWVFFSPKGWRLLTTAHQIADIGAQVDDLNTQVFAGTALLGTQNVLVCMAGGLALAYDYYTRQWSKWSAPGGTDIVPYGDGYVFTDGTYLRQDSDTKLDAGVAYNLEIETPWISCAGINGYGVLYEFTLLGEYVADHKLRVRVYYDNVYTAVDDKTWTVDTARYQIRHRPARPKGRVFKMRFTDAAGNGTLADSAKWVALSILIGTIGRLARQPSTRSQ